MLQHQHTRGKSYEEVSEDGHDLSYTSPSRFRRTLYSVLQFVLGLVVCLSLVGALCQARLAANQLARISTIPVSQGLHKPSFLHTTHPLPEGFGLVYNSSYCNGVKDPQGARQKGCVFDPVHGGWIHRLCSDDSLREEFIGLNDFGWYTDVNRTIPILQDDVWQGKSRTSTFTIDDYHFRHCEYILKTMIKNGKAHGVGLGFKLMNKEHLDHCLDRLINFNTPEIRNAPTETVV